jgi:hypothetical protein
MEQAVSRRPLTAEVRVPSRDSAREVFGGQSGVGRGFCPNTRVVSCRYHSTNAPCPFIHLPPTLYNVSLRILELSPVGIIAPMLHAHSFVTYATTRVILGNYSVFKKHMHTNHVTP